MKMCLAVLILTVTIVSGKNICPPNSRYVECASVCPITCEGLVGLCTEQCVEGCVCNDGYVQNGNECMDRKKCPTGKPKPRRG